MKSKNSTQKCEPVIQVTIIVPSPLDINNPSIIQTQITRSELFDDDHLENKEICLTVGSDTVKIINVNGALSVIANANTICANVRIMGVMHIFALHIQINGVCQIDAPLDLRMGAHISAADVYVDKPIKCHEYLNLIAISNNKNDITINKPVSTNRLLASSDGLYLNAKLDATKSILRFNHIKQTHIHDSKAMFLYEDLSEFQREQFNNIVTQSHQLNNEEGSKKIINTLDEFTDTFMREIDSKRRLHYEASHPWFSMGSKFMKNLFWSCSSQFEKIFNSFKEFFSSTNNLNHEPERESELQSTIILISHEKSEGITTVVSPINENNSISIISEDKTLIIDAPITSRNGAGDLFLSAKNIYFTKNAILKANNFIFKAADQCQALGAQFIGPGVNGKINSMDVKACSFVIDCTDQLAKVMQLIRCRPLIN